MEWSDVKDDIERYGKMDQPDIVNIVKSGIDTEFWKWLRACIALRVKIAENELKLSDATKLDYLIALGQFNAIYKAYNMILNLPELVLKATTITKLQEDKRRELELQKQVLNAR